jgi:hypothetical protein
MWDAISVCDRDKVSPAATIRNWHHEGWQHLSAIPTGRVCQPYPRSARKRLDAQTLGPASGFRGGKQSRNRAIVALARKLAVLLHRIWVTQKPYVPFYAEAA